MEGSVFLKAEWKVSKTDSAHWASRFFTFGLKHSFQNNYLQPRAGERKVLCNLCNLFTLISEIFLILDRNQMEITCETKYFLYLVSSNFKINKHLQNDSQSICTEEFARLWIKISSKILVTCTLYIIYTEFTSYSEPNSCRHD